MNQELNNELLICVVCENEFEDLYDSTYCYDCYSRRIRIFGNYDEEEDADEEDEEEEEEDEGNDADDEKEEEEIENMIEELLTDITEYECVVIDIE